MVNVLLDPVKTNLDIEYISRAKEYFKDKIFIKSDVHSNIILGPVTYRIKCDI